MDYVIGSGLSGVMCARALLERGRKVTMVDVGSLPPSNATEIKRRLSSLAPESWEKEILNGVSGTLAQEKGRVPSRLYFNSYYMYADTTAKGIIQQGTNCRMSQAQGGLGMVWGAATLPAQGDDFAEWPFSVDRMHMHYAAVSKEIGITGVHDELESLFPFYSEPLPADDLSQQAAWVNKKLTKHQKRLRSLGFTAGRSRLAYRSSGNTFGCKKCTLCLSGCPFDAIYSATDTLRKLEKNDRFTYIRGCEVDHVAESGQKVLLYVAQDGEEKILECDRVFIACGPLGTLRLISRSRNVEQESYELRYQPYFMLPLFSLKNFRNIEKEKTNTMAQLFLELNDRAISERTVHMQVYTYSPQIQSEIDRLFGRIPFLKRIIDRFVTGRLLLIQGYVHASDAPPIPVVKSSGLLTLEGVNEYSVKKLIRRVAWKLFRMSFFIGAVPLLPMLKYGLPGDGNHAGSTFAMSKTPSGNQTDEYGRLCEYRRVHIVDSSVLSSIPAPTISYTVMANAHRIGWESAELDIVPL